MAVTPEQDSFSNVSWSEHAQEEHSPPVPAVDETGPGALDPPVADDEDAAQRLGSERLECTVDTPIKENDGTKDAFVSYLITTSVRWTPCCLGSLHHADSSRHTVHLPLFPARAHVCAPPLHRLRLPLQAADA